MHATQLLPPPHPLPKPHQKTRHRHKHNRRTPQHSSPLSPSPNLSKSGGPASGSALASTFLQTRKRHHSRRAVNTKSIHQGNYSLLIRQLRKQS